MEEGKRERNCPVYKFGFNEEKIQICHNLRCLAQKELVKSHSLCVKQTFATKKVECASLVTERSYVVFKFVFMAVSFMSLTY